jgi:hypothetical protein
MPVLQNPVVDADDGLAFDFLGLFSPRFVLLTRRHTIVFGFPADALSYRSIGPLASCSMYASPVIHRYTADRFSHAVNEATFSRPRQGLAHMAKLGFQPKSRNFKPFGPPEKIRSL